MVECRYPRLKRLEKTGGWVLCSKINTPATREHRLGVFGWIIARKLGLWPSFWMTLDGVAVKSEEAKGVRTEWVLARRGAMERDQSGRSLPHRWLSTGIEGRSNTKRPTFGHCREQ